MNDRSAIGLLIVVAVGLQAPVAAAADGWPGAPPDCWTQPRLVHGPGISAGNYEALWHDKVRIERFDSATAATGERSPNGGYVFAVGEHDQTSFIDIDAEQAQRTRIVIDIDKGQSLHEVKWINEKLIFGRIAWGRIAVTDFIFDVETNAFVWHASATDGAIAMDQYRQSCPLLGCTCIQKAQP